MFAYINGAGAIPYATSKAAVGQLGCGLGVELASHGASAMTGYFSLIETDARLAHDAGVRLALARLENR